MSAAGIAQALPETASDATRSDLQVVIKRIEGKLSIALNLLSEEERHDIMYELDGDYCGGVWAELEALL